MEDTSVSDFFSRGGRSEKDDVVENGPGLVLGLGETDEVRVRRMRAPEGAEYIGQVVQGQFHGLGCIMYNAAGNVLLVCC